MVVEFTTCTRNSCIHGWGTNLREFCATLDSIQPSDKTSTNGHRNCSFSSLTLTTNKRILQKKIDAEKILSTLLDKTDHNAYFNKLPFGSKRNLQKWTILHYVWLSSHGYVNSRSISMKFLNAIQLGIGMNLENILLFNMCSPRSKSLSLNIE